MRNYTHLLYLFVKWFLYCFLFKSIHCGKVCPSEGRHQIYEFRTTHGSSPGVASSDEHFGMRIEIWRYNHNSAKIRGNVMQKEIRNAVTKSVRRVQKILLS